MSASEIVFGIAELCEAILLYLPPKDLIVSAQCLSKSWQTLVNTSPQIQRKLFFKPHAEGKWDIILTTNPFFSKICRFFIEQRVLAYVAEPMEHPTYGTKIGTRFAAYFPLHEPMKATTLESKQSWQRMNVTDFPCEIHVYVHIRRPVYTEKRNVSMTMGELMTMVTNEWV